MKRVLTIVTVFLMLIAAGSYAETITVRQNGTGDYSTITAALLAAQSGDIISVGVGTYYESLMVNKSVTLESDAGADMTILHGNDLYRQMIVETDVSVTLRGFTFTHGYADEGAALLIWNQPDVVVEDCKFIENFATGSNAVQVRHVGTSASFFRCEFLRNDCNLHSSALSISFGGALTVADCVFADNTSNGVSGAVNCNAGVVDFHGNLFLRNSGPGAGALVIQFSATGQVRGNTFHENSGRDHGAVLIASAVTFEQNIVTGTLDGPGLTCYDPTAHFCNLYFDNVDGSIIGSELGDNEIEEEPLYCGWPEDNFSLCVMSPALVVNNGCGTMGAYGEGCIECGVVPTEAQTWGGLKNLYR